jgi:hypothetical protein
MVNDDLLKCPLCGGFTHVESPELLAALHDPKVRRQVENYVAGLLRSAPVELVAASGPPKTRNFNEEVHNWNPHVPVWRRSPKE